MPLGSAVSNVPHSVAGNLRSINTKNAWCHTTAWHTHIRLAYRYRYILGHFASIASTLSILHTNHSILVVLTQQWSNAATLRLQRIVQGVQLIAEDVVFQLPKLDFATSQLGHVKLKFCVLSTEL